MAELPSYVRRQPESLGAGRLAGETMIFRILGKAEALRLRLKIWASVFLRVYSEYLNVQRL